MENSDTMKLLKECDAGTRMAVESINEVLDHAEDIKLKILLQESREHHIKLEKEIESSLLKQDASEKEPNSMAKSMSWIKINMKLGMNHSDATIADLMTDGCNMGIKSLYKYLNQYQAADGYAKEICRTLAGIEEELCRQLRKFL